MYSTLYYVQWFQKKSNIHLVILLFSKQTFILNFVDLGSVYRQKIRQIVPELLFLPVFLKAGLISCNLSYIISVFEKVAKTRQILGQLSFQTSVYLMLHQYYSTTSI